MCSRSQTSPVASAAYQYQQILKDKKYNFDRSNPIPEKEVAAEAVLKDSKGKELRSEKKGEVTEGVCLVAVKQSLGQLLSSLEACCY